MTDDAKEWVTIKVPKTVRDEAREDARTYGEIMRAGLEGDDGNDIPDPDDLSIPSSVTSNAEPSDALCEQLDRLESSASTIEERTGRIERTLEDMGARR